MRSLIIGMGEVGSSLLKVLDGVHEVQTLDIDTQEEVQTPIDVMHICMRYSDKFIETVEDYISKYRPGIVDVCTTVPPGTTEALGAIACHSTTRGLHPNLEKSIRTFTKHIGGPLAVSLEEYYMEAGIVCATHATSRTTELAHILSNSIYGLNLVLADELADICRKYGVDYVEAVTQYNMTSNEGYQKLGHKSKMRMILTPPNGRIGGHCVAHGAKLLKHRGTLLEELLKYA